MQVLFFLGIALCLVVDTSTKSVRSIYHVTGEPESPLNSVQQVKDDPTDEEKLKKKCKDTCGFENESLEENGVTCNPVENSESVKSESSVDVTCECSGENEGKVFDYEEKKCKKTCHENVLCKNGGTCMITDVGGYCVCKHGTGGDWCDMITECQEKNCGSEATCVYDSDLEKAVCRCNNLELSLDPRNNKCKKTCNKIAVCINGGTCEKTDIGSYCRCKPGTEGDLCYTVPDCTKRNCGNEATCVYDVKLERAVCRCKNSKFSFDPNNKKCKQPCKTSEDCKNGAKCEINDDGNYCKCKTGTEGDLCDIVTECLRKECGNEATCVYDDKQEKAVCRCNNPELSLDPRNNKCKNPCTKTEDCENGGSCENTESGKFCRCQPRTEGDFCEIISECSNMDCGPDAKCLYDDNREAVCRCNDNTLSFDPVDIRCKMCDCGNNSFSCGFIDGKKVCNCHRFHGQKDGQCEICFCGINAKSCRYDNRGNKVCDCPEGSVEINGRCEKIPLTSTFRPIEITANATRISSVEHSWDFTTLNRTSVPSSSTVRPTDGDPCYVNPCQNGGTCLFINNRSKCFCRKPYLGILCETDPCDWNPCMNEGVCKIEKEEVKCYCKEPFAGKFCESPIKLDAYVVTLVAASVFSAIVLIFVTCVMCQRCRIVRTS